MSHHGLPGEGSGTGHPRGDVYTQGRAARFLPQQERRGTPERCFDFAQHDKATPHAPPTLTPTLSRHREREWDRAPTRGRLHPGQGCEVPASAGTTGDAPRDVSTSLNMTRPLPTLRQPSPNLLTPTGERVGQGAHEGASTPTAGLRGSCLRRNDGGRPRDVSTSLNMTRPLPTPRQPSPQPSPAIGRGSETGHPRGGVYTQGKAARFLPPQHPRQGCEIPPPQEQRRDAQEGLQASGRRGRRAAAGRGGCR